MRTRRFTTSCTEEMAEQHKGGDPFPKRNSVRARVVQDGQVITAQGHAPVDFAAVVCRALRGYDDPAREYAELWKICDTDAWKA